MFVTTRIRGRRPIKGNRIGTRTAVNSRNVRFSISSIERARGMRIFARANGSCSGDSNRARDSFARAVIAYRAEGTTIFYPIVIRAELVAEKPVSPAFPINTAAAPSLRNDAESRQAALSPRMRACIPEFPGASRTETENGTRGFDDDDDDDYSDRNLRGILIRAAHT